MKIHISLETKILLDSIGGYILEPRGLIMVDVSRCPQKPHYKDFPPQGHDQRETFWLTGRIFLFKVLKCFCTAGIITNV